MTSLTKRLATIALACCAGGALVFTQTPAPQAPAPQTPPQTPAPAPAAPAQGGGRGLDAQVAMGADFLKRPPVARQTPEAQQQMFVLQPGFKAELVMADPLIEDPVGVTFDGNGRMYVLEMRS